MTWCRSRRDAQVLVQPFNSSNVQSPIPTLNCRTVERLNRVEGAPSLRKRSIRFLLQHSAGQKLRV
jgi:hypothetical protein